jgi:beta-galactosidase
MKWTLNVFLLLLAALTATHAFAVPAAGHAAHTFTAQNGQFMLDGKPFRIISGEVHYVRVPRTEWRQTFRMAKAMGLNTITTYVFWNAHEATPGVYDFSGNNDIAEFLREAQQEGLYVILRPGPYVCAEWDLGGLPAWLLKDKSMPLRTNDPRYMQPVRKWLMRLGQELAPLQIANGGPIIAVQVENEYGSYGSDRGYIRAMRQVLIDAGFGKSLFYTADGLNGIPKDALPDMLAGLNFGPGDPSAGGAKASMDKYKELRPTCPYIVSEYWDGWFDHWGEPWNYTAARQQADEIQYILSHGSSISIYMFQGGTSFGWMNGANSPQADSYQPDVTSYDYDAALSESGQPTPKYYLFRNAIARATGVEPPPVPKAPKLAAMPVATFSSSVSLWKTLPPPRHSEHLLSMEDIGQGYGYILYRTTLKDAISGTLDLGVMHQYAQVYVNGKLAGIADRRLKQHTVAITSVNPGARLDILVENTGRINFGPRMLGERIGLLTDVTIAGATLTGWDIYALPMRAPQNLAFTVAPCTGPCFYRATLNVTKPLDTYLDTRELHKGQLWVNGRNLGRFWNVGPQGALFVPASWLKAGQNEIVIFDLQGAPGRKIAGLDHPVID